MCKMYMYFLRCMRGPLHICHPVLICILVHWHHNKYGRYSWHILRTFTFFLDTCALVSLWLTFLEPFRGKVMASCLPSMLHIGNVYSKGLLIVMFFSLPSSPLIYILNNIPWTRVTYLVETNETYYFWYKVNHLGHRNFIFLRGNSLFITANNYDPEAPHFSDSISRICAICSGMQNIFPFSNGDELFPL